MRDTVGAICSGFGPSYSRRKHRRGPAAHRAVGRARGEGLPRREHPRGVGRRRPRDVRAGRGGRGDLRGGQLAAADRGLARDRGQHPRPPRHRRQKDRWLRGIAAGTTKVAFAITEPDAGTNSHNLATAARARRRPLPAARPEDLHLGRGARRRRAGGGAQPAADGSLGLPSLCLVDVDAPGFTREAIPMPLHRAGQAVDALLRRRRAARRTRLIGGEGGGLGPVFDGLNPERIMGAAIAAAPAAARSAKAAAYANERVGLGRPDRHAPGSRPSARGGEDRAGAGPAHDAEGGGPLRRRRARRRRGEQHGQVRGRGGGASPAWIARSRPTAATASRSSTG